MTGQYIALTFPLPEFTLLVYSVIYTLHTLWKWIMRSLQTVSACYMHWEILSWHDLIFLEDYFGVQYERHFRCLLYALHCNLDPTWSHCEMVQLSWLFYSRWKQTTHSNNARHTLQWMNSAPLHNFYRITIDVLPHNKNKSKVVSFSPAKPGWVCWLLDHVLSMMRGALNLKSNYLPSKKASQLTPADSLLRW